MAVLDHTAELGGAELALVRLLEGLDADRVEPVVVLFAEGPLARRLRSAGHAVEVVPLDERLGAASRRLTPVGAALLGLTVGQKISWDMPDKRVAVLEVLAVRQPSDTPPH